MTTKEAAKKAYDQVGDVFYGLQIHYHASQLCGRSYAYPDTFLRKLRTFREEGEINFRPIGSRNLSKYKKIKDDSETNINR